MKKKPAFMKYVFLFVLALGMSTIASSQTGQPSNSRSQSLDFGILDFGLKSGINVSWIRYVDKVDRKATKTLPVVGFNAGAAFNFKLKKRYFLHTELIYSTKGKRLTENTFQPDLYHEQVIYHFVELPLTYNIYFRGHVNSMRQFKWYAGVGPNLSYWLGGRGKLAHYQFDEFEFPSLKYKIKFGERGDDSRAENVYIERANRFQLGINLGGGILLEPSNGSKIMVDLRFEVGHSWLAKSESANYAFPADYGDNLHARNLGARLSVMYLLERNLDKKTRNKGKSTIKRRDR